jgi:glutathione S-transferase
MTTMTLFFAPDSCARVPLIALEEIGNPYKLELVAFVSGQHKSPEYLALNPKAKVPTLVVDGEPLTENVAILSWLAERFPQAGLLPEFHDDFARARLIADLTYCASGLHPIVTRLRIPHFFCDTAEGSRRVFEMAELAMHPNFDLIERRLGISRWWYGEHWSIVDAYINWVWFRVTGTQFDGSAYPNLRRHDAQMKERPAVQRALAISASRAAELASRGLGVTFMAPGATAAASGQP